MVHGEAVAVAMAMAMMISTAAHAQRWLMVFRPIILRSFCKMGTCACHLSFIICWHQLAPITSHDSRRQGDSSGAELYHITMIIKLQVIHRIYAGFCSNDGKF